MIPLPQFIFSTPVGWDVGKKLFHLHRSFRCRRPGRSLSPPPASGQESLAASFADAGVPQGPPVADIRSLWPPAVLALPTAQTLNRKTPQRLNPKTLKPKSPPIKCTPNSSITLYLPSNPQTLNPRAPNLLGGSGELVTSYFGDL